MDRCYICKEIVPYHTALIEKDSWYWFNVAANAASGGTMMPVHHRCKPVHSLDMTPPMTPSAEVMPVVDYEAASRLAENMKKWSGQGGPDFNDSGLGNLARAYLALLQRAEKAEAGLKRYGKHEPGCAIGTLSEDDAAWFEAKCQCGLADLIGAS